MRLEAYQERGCVVVRRVERVGLKSVPHTPPNFLEKRGGVRRGSGMRVEAGGIEINGLGRTFLGRNGRFLYAGQWTVAAAASPHRK